MPRTASWNPIIGERLDRLADLLPPDASFDDPAVAAQLGILGAPAGPEEIWEVTARDATTSGTLPVPVRIYTPDMGTSGSARPALVWVHGGGYRFGNLDDHEAHDVALGIAGRADAVVLSVDYRLCVDGVHFPAPHEDVFTAITWVQSNADRLGIDPARIAVGGASAGANLAACAALRLRDEGTSAWQLFLAYPVVHKALPAASSGLTAACAQAPTYTLFTDDMVTEMSTNYRGRSPDAPYQFAGDHADLAGLPATYLDHDEFDTLRASGEAFGDQLRRAGVSVEEHRTTGVLHGHLSIRGFTPARATLDRIAQRLQADVL